MKLKACANTRRSAETWEKAMQSGLDFTKLYEFQPLNSFGIGYLNRQPGKKDLIYCNHLALTSSTISNKISVDVCPVLPSNNQM
jgi:hypothetical protein